MGEQCFIKNQYGIESPSAHGTPVAATNRFSGTVELPEDRQPVFPQDKTGLRVEAQRAVIYQILLDNIKFSHAHPIFQDLPWLFSCGLVGGQTPVEQTTDQDDYLWNFTPDLDSTNTPDSSTVETGDDTQAYEVEYVMFKNYTFKGKLGGNEPVTFEGNAFGKQRTPTTFTPGIPLLSANMEPMIANKTDIYIDSSWATKSTTRMTELMREFTIDLITGVHYKFNSQGALTMTGHGESVVGCNLAFTFEGNSYALAQETAFRAKTSKAIELQIIGGPIGTGENHSMILGLFGTWEKVLPVGGSQNGDNLTMAVFHGHSDGLATPHFLDLQVITNVPAF